jgi:hypothetical protein
LTEFSYYETVEMKEHRRIDGKREILSRFRMLRPAGQLQVHTRFGLRVKRTGESHFLKKPKLLGVATASGNRQVPS